MKKSAFTLIVLWSYLLVVSYFGLNSYSGVGIKNLGAWQLMLASALIIPIVVFGIICEVNSSANGNKDAIKFVALNKNQLKAYGLGVLLLVIIVGGLIMAVAAIWGILGNAFLIINAVVKKHG